MGQKNIFIIVCSLFLSVGLFVAPKIFDTQKISARIMPVLAAEENVLSGEQAAKPVLTHDQQARIISLSVPWIKNDGQFDNKSVKFSVNTLMGTVFVTEDGAITYSLNIQDKSKTDDINSRPRGDNKRGARSVVIKEIPIYKNTPVIQGSDPSPTKTSFFIGNDESKWKTNISTYNLVSYGYIYPKIKLSLKAHNNNVEKIYTIYPGGIPEDINIRVDGAKDLQIIKDGELAIIPAEDNKSLESIYLTKPIAYQNINGQRIFVPIKYKITGNAYSFHLGQYNPQYSLTIDPSFNYLLASTFLGGSGTDAGNFIAFDSAGNVYITGQTASTNFPVTAGAASSTYGGHDWDGFVLKLNNNLTTLQASTYLGGSGDDYGIQIIVDPSGDVYIGGQTTSANFPGTAGSYQAIKSGAHDGFIAELNNNLTTVLICTYLGGDNFASVNSIVRDSSGNIYAAGEVDTGGFPVTAGVASTTYGGGYNDAFVSKLNSGLTVLLASTYLGGTGNDFANHIILDSSGNVYVAGDTTGNFPVTVGAYQTTYGGGSFLGDAFVAKLNSDLTQVSAATYLGGDNNDAGYSIALDSLGNVYVAGYTASSNFPTTIGAYQTAFGGAYDNFVSKLTSNLSALSASTYLGGSGIESYNDLSIDSTDNVYLVARTGSSNFPTTPGVYQTSYGGGTYDAFIAKFGPLLPNVALVAPNSIQQNSGTITLTVTGSNFIPTSVVKFDGNAKTTTYISATQLTATISSSDYQNIGNHNVTVFNPLDDGGTSASAPFLVTTTGISSPQSPTAPAPTLENPTGVFSLLINPVTLADGSLISATSTSDHSVTLKFLVGADTATMAISEDPDFKNAIQEPYQSTKIYLLSLGDGTKTIYAKFYSFSGVSSPVVSASIMLNTVSLQIIPSTLTLPVITSGTTTTKETEAPAEEKKESIASPGFIIFTKTLAFGSTGSEVRSLQQELQGLGFFPKTQKLTNYFGPITRRALKNFQQAHHLPPVGIVGPKTRAILNGI